MCVFNFGGIHMDWKKLHFGHMHIAEVLIAVKDEEWQCVRVSMKGVSLQRKYDTLITYLQVEPTDRQRQIRVTNYVTALSRGGLIKPCDYVN